MSRDHADDDHDVRKALEGAAQTQALVRLSRSLPGSDVLEGFVVGLGRMWLLLAELDHTIQLNGFVALRLGDVTRVEPRGGRDTFVGRALQARGQWPPAGAPVDLDDVAELIRTAGDVAPLVTVHPETDDPQVGHVGVPVAFSDGVVHLREITPEAEWEESPTPRSLRDITRVEFGGRYEDALAIVGGPPPP